MRHAWILALTVSVSGCAYGGGDRADSGGGGMIDANLPRSDSGLPPGFDSGMLPGTDSGMRVDAGGGSCSETPCRLVSPQCGCAPGEGCYLSGTSRTCGTPGPEREGQSCSGATSCVPGNLCIGSGADGFCAKLCNSDLDCPGGSGSLCLTQLSDGAGGAIPGVTLCTVHCTPPSGSGCPSGMGCALFQEGDGAMRTFTSCRPAGTLTTGSICADEEDCAPGYFCPEVSAGRRECVRLCTMPGGFECAGLDTCMGFADRVVIGGTEYGYCF